MTLQLIKIQEGVGEGNVLFHSFGEDRAGWHGDWGLRPEAFQDGLLSALNTPESW